MGLGCWRCCCSYFAQNVVHQPHSGHVALGALPCAVEALILGKVMEGARVTLEGKVEEQHNSYDLVERDY